ncbi:hypothetical protein JW968_04110 [Candidatus Woesearchaeota archaeon]|nr:hypothetical protein [Candidatus Woesearchaeota archaeon]
MNLKIPGYHTEFFSEIYTSSTLMDAESGTIEVQKILVPQRYTLPTMPEIISHIQQRAQEMVEFRGELDPNLIVISNNPVTRMLGIFPIEVLNNIVTGDRDYTHLFEKAVHLHDPKAQFLKVSYGEIPTGYIMEMIEHEIPLDISWFMSHMLDEDLREAGWGSPMGCRCQISKRDASSKIRS